MLPKPKWTYVQNMVLYLIRPFPETLNTWPRAELHCIFWQCSLHGETFSCKSRGKNKKKNFEALKSEPPYRIYFPKPKSNYIFSCKCSISAVSEPSECFVSTTERAISTRRTRTRPTQTTQARRSPNFPITTPLSRMRQFPLMMLPATLSTQKALINNAAHAASAVNGSARGDRAFCGFCSVPVRRP